MPEAEPTEESEEEWVDVGTYPTLDHAYDHALVALAMGESVRVQHSENNGEFDLQAEPEAAPKISKELVEYIAESETKSLPEALPSNWAKRPAGIPLLMLWIASLALVFRLQSSDPSLADRFASSNIALIEHREWWRLFTALFLHADFAHMMGNIASGSVFGILVSKSIGSLKGWALILLSGALGNATTSFITYPEPFISLGASSAVFGALGILSGIGIVENCYEKVRMPWIRVIAPFIAGLVLLGWLGGAEPGSNTDVFGHVFGFLAGMLSGAACRHLTRDKSEALRQPPNQAI